MEPEEKGSKDESRREQSNMSEGAADPHGMGAMSHIKPVGANAQPQTESGTAEPPPFRRAPKQLNVVFGNFMSF